MEHNTALAWALLCQRTIQLTHATLEWDKARADYLATDPYDPRNSGTHERHIMAVSHTNPDLVSSITVEKETLSNPYRNGYGAKIPTRYKLKYGGGRLRRVWVTQYGNSGSAYIVDRGRSLYLDLQTEYALEAAQEIEDGQK